MSKLRGGDNVNVYNAMIAGSMSGMLAKTFVAPLDRIRIIYQVNQEQFSMKIAYLTGKNIVAEDGLRAMWKGNSASMIRVVPYSAIQFTVHEWLKAAFNIQSYQQKLNHPLLSFCAGAFAGGTAITCTYPLDVARARMAADPQYSSLMQVFKKGILSRDKKFGLYRGFLPAAVAVIPYTGVSFLIYELFKTRYFHQVDTAEGKANKTLLALQNTGLALMVSFIGQTTIYPLDIVRRRMQVDTKHENLAFRKAFMGLVRKEGLLSLYKGITLSWLKLPIVVGINFGTFDTLYYLLNKHVQYK